MISKLSKSLILCIVVFSSACEPVDSPDSVVTSPSTTTQTSNNKPSPAASVKPVTPSKSPSPSASSGDDIDLSVDKPGEPDQNEIVGTDTVVAKSNVDWKSYYPVIQGKKYVYLYTIKEGDSSVQTEVNMEVTSVKDKNFVLKQSFASSSATSSLGAKDIPMTLNNDYSPPLIPPISVGGEKVDVTKNVQIIDKTEKVKVPFKEFDAIKVIVDEGNGSTLTNWYGKDVGLIKSISVSSQGTYTLELKDYK